MRSPRRRTLTSASPASAITRTCSPATGRLDKNRKLRFGYRFENYRARDFGHDVMRPYMGFVDSGSATSVYLGARQPGYHAHVLSLAAQAAF